MLRYFADDPRVLGVLVDVTATAPFATELLVRNPEFLHWLVGEINRTPPDATDLADEATSALVAFADPVARLDSLKRFQRRELLRIAGREAIGRATAAETARQLSLLAETTVDLVLSEAIRRVPSATGAALVVVAVGALAARELDYGTILDVAIIGDDAQAHRAAGSGRLEAVAARLVADLADESVEGAFYELRQPFVGPNAASPLILEGQWRNAGVVRRTRTVRGRSGTRGRRGRRTRGARVASSRPPGERPHRPLTRSRSDSGFGRSRRCGCGSAGLRVERGGRVRKNRLELRELIRGRSADQTIQVLADRERVPDARRRYLAALCVRAARP